MKPITNEDIKVLGRIVNISTENVVADASQVWDSEQKKDQETINDSLINKTDNATTSKYGIVRLAVNASDPDNNDVVTVKTMRDAISEAVDALLAGEMTLDTFRELAEALNNDPNFYTWVTNQLALKADKSALDALTGRVSALESDVAYLKACCAEVQEYMQHFSITWNQAKGGSHVRISPTTIKFGSNTVLFTIDDGYYLGEPISTSNVEGSYATVSCTESNGTYTLILTGVEGNVVINAPIKKEFTVTFMGDGHATSSNTSTKTVKGAYTTNITAATNYYLNTSTIHPRYATSAQEYTDQPFSFSLSTSGTDYSSDSSSTVAVSASISLSGVNGDIIIPAETKPLKRTVKVNLTGDGGATFSGATGQMNRGISYSGTITVPSNSTLDSVVVLQYVMSSPGSGYWMNMTSTYYNSSTRTISTTNLYDDITIVIRSSALGTGPTPPDPVTASSVTLVVNNGTANPSTGYLDGEFSSVITPNTGYTLTGAQITSTDSFIEPELENGVLTISQIGLEDITVTVTLQPSSTPVTYGTVTVSPDHGTASPASFSADGTSHTITITPASGYTTTGMTATTTNNDLTVSVSGNTITVTGTSSNNATINVTVPAESTPTPSGPALSGTISASDEFNAFGRVEPLHDILGSYTAYDWGTSDPYSYGTQYVDVNLGNISNFAGLSGSTNSDKLNDLKTKLSFDYYLIQGVVNGNVSYYERGSITDEAPSSGTTATNTQCPFSVADIVLDGSDVVVKVACLPTDFSGSVTTETHTEGDPGNIEYGEDPLVTETGLRANGSTRQYVSGSRHLTDMKITYSGDNSFAYSRLIRNIYGIDWPAMNEIVDGSLLPGARYYFNASVSYALPECAFDEYDESSITYSEGSLEHYTIGDGHWAVYPTGTQNAVTLNNVEAKYQGNGAYYYRVTPVDVLANGSYDVAMQFVSTNPSQYPSLSGLSIGAVTVSS